LAKLAVAALLAIRTNVVFCCAAQHLMIAQDSNDEKKQEGQKTMYPDVAAMVLNYFIQSNT